MAKNLFVACWPIDSFGDTANLLLADKLERLSDAVNRASAFLSASANRVGVADPLMLFAAPEYYFIKSGAGVEPMTLYSDDERSTLYDQLKGISRAAGKMVLVPGTVSWQKPKRRPAGERTFDGYNTTPILFKGKLKHEYHKIWDDGNYKNRTTDVEFVPGTKSQLFKLGGLKYGIEVCGDFDGGNLAKEARACSLDVEVYISGYNKHSFSPENMGRVPVKDGGYFVHCEAGGGAERVGVWCIKRGGGWHGTSTDYIPGAAFDPWTLEQVRLDSATQAGIKLARSTVLSTEIGANYQTFTAGRPVASGGPPPAAQRRGSVSLPSGPTAPRERRGSLPLPGNIKEVTKQLVWGAIRPVARMEEDGRYRVIFNVIVREQGGDGSGVDGHAIAFAADHGRVSDATVVTNREGTAQATVTATKAAPTVVTAKIGGAEISCTLKLVSLGAGNCSRMSQLRGNPHDDLSCWHVPVI